MYATAAIAPYVKSLHKGVFTQQDSSVVYPVNQPSLEQIIVVLTEGMVVSTGSQVMLGKRLDVLSFISKYKLLAEVLLELLCI